MNYRRGKLLLNWGLSIMLSISELRLEGTSTKRKAKRSWRKKTRDKESFLRRMALTTLGCRQHIQCCILRCLDDSSISHGRILHLNRHDAAVLSEWLSDMHRPMRVRDIKYTEI